MSPPLSAYTECPKCYSSIRLRRAEKDWARCLKCQHEWDPQAEDSAPEWQED